MAIDTQNLTDYIHEFAFEYGKLFRTRLTPEDVVKRISDKMPLPEEVVKEFELKIELEKQLAIQDWLLDHGNNDEKVNEKIRTLNRKINAHRTNGKTEIL